MLEPYTPNPFPNRSDPPPPSIEVEGEPKYKIDRIVDSKLNRRRKKCQLLYKVMWLGYQNTDEESSWLLATELEHTDELRADFHAAYPSKPGPLSSL